MATIRGLGPDNGWVIFCAECQSSIGRSYKKNTAPPLLEIKERHEYDHELGLIPDNLHELVENTPPSFTF